MPEAMRFNNQKVGMHLLPFDALMYLAKVYDYGAEKYDDHNWRKGFKETEGCGASLLRHYSFYSLGEDVDPESGLLHTAHVAWNALTLLAQQLHDVGEDDRFCLTEQELRNLRFILEQKHNEPPKRKDDD